MAIAFKDEAFIEQFAFESTEKNKPSGISNSKNITGIEVRLSRVFIINNKTPKVGPFPGFSKLYMVIIVVSDVGNAVQTLDLKDFPKVGDHEDLPVDKTIYYWKQQNKKDKSPSQIHVFTSIIKSKQSLRNAGKILADAKNDEEFEKVVTDLKAAVKDVSKVATVSNLLFSVAGALGKFLGKVDDKPLFTWVQSFTDINGDFDKLGKTTTGRKNDYVALDLSVIIRDTNREEELAKMHNMIIEELAIAKNGALE